MFVWSAMVLPSLGVLFTSPSNYGQLWVCFVWQWRVVGKWLLTQAAVFKKAGRESDWSLLGSRLGAHSSFGPVCRIVSATTLEDSTFLCVTLTQHFCLDLGCISARFAWVPTRSGLV